MTSRTPKKFPVILADCPWRFKTWSAKGKGKSADNHYATMPLNEIKNMVVPAAENCALFFWATWPLLPQALSVLPAWGFEYKTLAWVWIKLNKKSASFFTGLGYYTRSNSEPCLLAVRGVMPVNSHSVLSVIASPVQEHSRKPSEQYAKIEALYDGPYLELFARRPRPGWSVWGNEVQNSSDVVIGRKYETK